MENKEKFEMYANTFKVESQKYYAVGIFGWYCGKKGVWHYICTDYESALKKWQYLTGYKEYYNFEYTGGEVAEWQIIEITEKEYMDYLTNLVYNFYNGVIQNESENIDNLKENNAYKKGCIDMKNNLIDKLNDLIDSI